MTTAGIIQLYNRHPLRKIPMVHRFRRILYLLRQKAPKKDLTGHAGKHFGYAFGEVLVAGFLKLHRPPALCVIQQMSVQMLGMDAVGFRVL